MPVKKVAVIHDMSGFGRCSLTVVIPVLSAMGVQCCPLPTAYLSTHTADFEGFTFKDLTDQFTPVSNHWKSLGLSFDAIYSGFLASAEQIGLIKDFIRRFAGAGHRRAGRSGHGRRGQALPDLHPGNVRENGACSPTTPPSLRPT